MATGSSIPGAGVYLQQQAQAQQAYQQAMNDIQYRRGQMYNQFGLMPGGKVDPYSQFGSYQTMLGQEGNQLHAAQNINRARGLGSSGLGGQVMARLRQGQAGQNLGFQQTLMNNLHGFDTESLNAGSTLQNSLLAAQQGQEQWDFEHGQFTPPGVTGTPSPPGPGTTGTPRSVVAARGGVVGARNALAKTIAARRVVAGRQRAY